MVHFLNSGLMEKQKKDRYEMHKYWGKKPAEDLHKLINKYSIEGDILLDPFSGYGVFCCEAFLMNRSIITNDLNPIATFINLQLLEKDINLKLLLSQWESIKKEFISYINYWFQFKRDNQELELVSILRDNNDRPIKAKYKILPQKKMHEIVFNETEINDYLLFENESEIEDWFPQDILAQNSRIGAKEDMRVCDLFTKRTLACHAKLFSLLKKYSTGNELNLLKIAFTANLANCSKLVPPIKTRGELSQGAWMTGFYIGDTYIENNVLHYFENRLKKVVKGKEDYLKYLQKDLFNDNCNLGKVDNIKLLNRENIGYIISNNDAKNLNLPDNIIDYVFTDPPYGDVVPYFEQSIIWNSWLEFKPLYENEIIISDSKIRTKGIDVFEKEIDIAFSEIARVLKPHKYFSLTFHSLSGNVWKAVTNACIKNGFKLIDFQWLIQKSFTPRQINKLKTIKGDILVTFENTKENNELNYIDDILLENEIINIINQALTVRSLDTNEIFLLVMEYLFNRNVLINNLDLLSLLKDNYKLIEEKWII